VENVFSLFGAAKRACLRYSRAPGGKKGSPERGEEKEPDEQAEERSGEEGRRFLYRTYRNRQAEKEDTTEVAEEEPSSAEDEMDGGAKGLSQPASSDEADAVERRIHFCLSELHESYSLELD
jgi:hypothetical protein